MDTERGPRIEVLNSAGMPWIGIDVIIDGKVSKTDRQGCICLKNLIGSRLHRIIIGGKHLHLSQEVKAVREYTNIKVQNCMNLRSVIYPIPTK